MQNRLHLFFDVHWCPIPSAGANAGVRMPRQVKKLAPLFVKGSLAAGVYNDGDGLRLIVDRNGSKRWSFRFRWQNREPEMGLGRLSRRHARGRTGGCRMHGARAGAPTGNRNAWKHGEWSAQTTMLRRMIRELSANARAAAY